MVLAQEPSVLYVLSALAEVESADDRFLAKMTDLPLDLVRDAVGKLESGEFAKVERKGDAVVYVSLTNLGRSTFGYYWKQLQKRCGWS